MRRRFVATHTPTRPTFVVELHSSRRFPCSKSDLESLIAACPSSPSRSSTFSCGAVAARLFFRQWHEALDAVAFFWAQRLNGSHHLTPTVASAVPLPSDRDDLSARLKYLFTTRARELLESDGVHRWRKKIQQLRKEVEEISSAMKKPKRPLQFENFQRRRQGLVAELELLERRLEEFQAAMQRVMFHLDGPEWEENDEEIAVFELGGGLEWERIHHVMARECRRLDEALPIYSYRRAILRQIHTHQVMVLIGETGSGKSTQLVQFLADSGIVKGSIVCTQPRKIAVMSLAQRIREESSGCYTEDAISYYGSYSSVQKFGSKVIFMTDHCLLQHFMNDANLDGVACIIVDEAHERSLNTDLLLALVKKLLLQKTDLRLIIMSATADANQLSEYFYGCGTFHVMGRNFPVDIIYGQNAPEGNLWPAISEHSLGGCPPYVIDAVKMVAEIHRTEEDGAILVFLTSPSEVEWACEKFQSSSAVVLPLHGKLSCEEQRHVFDCYPGKRKVIFATNLAETSLTIPGVKYVLDSGMVKESRFEPSTGMSVLRVCRISQSSAQQRAGRAGRTGPGKCYRLYSECDFQLMSSHQEPEIRRVHLGIAVLKILSLGIEDVRDFDFIDAPSSEAINMAIRNLTHLGAIVSKNGVLILTDIGHQLVKLGIEPRLGKVILECLHYQLGREGLVLAAVMANAGSIFCRVGNQDERSKSDCLKVQFCHWDGDLFTLLSVYKEWDGEPQQSKNKWCWNNSINAKSMRRCKETILELEHCLQYELGCIVPRYWKWKRLVPTAYDRLLKKAILSSHAENVAMYSGYSRVGYEVALTGQHAQLHPSCSLLTYGYSPQWVVFGELLSVSKQYLACVTCFDYEFLLSLQPQPPFDASQLMNRKMEMKVIIGVGGNLLRRLCGKSNNSLHSLISQIQTECMDSRIGIDVDFDKREIHLFASSKDMPKVSNIVNDVVEHEKKWLRDDCIEKCLFPGGPAISPPVVLFGAGAAIRHLELDNRYLTMEVYHHHASMLNDKELLMMFSKTASGIAGVNKCASSGQEGNDLDRWGKITFLNPEFAKAAMELDGVEFYGSLLKVLPSMATFHTDEKSLPFPAVRAKVSWPRRHSKGVALIRCAMQDIDLIRAKCSNMMIGGSPVRCKLSKNYADSLVITGLSQETSEEEISDALRNAVSRRIMDVFLIRGEAVYQPSVVACADALLLREIAPFMPSRNCPHDHCRVQVFPPEPKDYSMKALITFDGSLHLEAAKAFQHLNGRALPGCLPWQKIQCQQSFHSSISCPASVYHVIKKELDILFERFNKEKGVVYNLERNNNGSFRVKISSNATKKVADLRKPLEQLMKGKTISHASLTPNVLQLLFSREGIGLMKKLEQETGTYILHDRQNLNVRIFGHPKDVAIAEQKFVQSLFQLHENKQLKIHLRSSHLPPNLMKEVVVRFGADLHGLKDKVPDAEFMLDTRRHVISIQGSKESKRLVEETILDIAQSLTGGPFEPYKEGSCAICLCEIEDCYRLEACGHGFCSACLVDQFESATKSHDGFPLCCAQEGCRSPILLVDLKHLLPSDKLEELFKASFAAFMASNVSVYRFCPSPDCPAVYQVADPGVADEQPPFVCGACLVKTCTKCHLEYHPLVSCERYKELKEDPDESLTEWKKGKDHVKKCPVCGYTIEKTEGCNHITCKCGKHVCWVCLKCFDTSAECYGHLNNEHGTIT